MDKKTLLCILASIYFGVVSILMGHNDVVSHLFGYASGAMFLAGIFYQWVLDDSK